MLTPGPRGYFFTADLGDPGLQKAVSEALDAIAGDLDVLPMQPGGLSPPDPSGIATAELGTAGLRAALFCCRERNCAVLMLSLWDLLSRINIVGVHNPFDEQSLVPGERR